MVTCGRVCSLNGCGTREIVFCGKAGVQLCMAGGFYLAAAGAGLRVGSWYLYCWIFFVETGFCLGWFVFLVWILVLSWVLYIGCYLFFWRKFFLSFCFVAWNSFGSVFAPPCAAGFLVGVDVDVFTGRLCFCFGLLPSYTFGNRLLSFGLAPCWAALWLF